MRSFTVAIAGGGASGVLAASMLLLHSAEANVVIIDPCERLGRGIAFATKCPRHLLNVPAGKMSALPSIPDHFVRWLATNVEGSYGPLSFVPRSLYGEYLTTIAADARTGAPNRWRHVRALVLDVKSEADFVRVVCSNGDEIEADSLVVACGNAAPTAWPDVAPAPNARQYFASAWDEGAIHPGSPNDTVLLLGMGLTAVDAVFGLRHNGHRGRIFMVSRRGLLPHEHRVFDAPPSTVPEAKTVSELLDSVRTLVRDMERPGDDWRRVIDDVRPHTNALWKALSIEEQRRFLRHALPYWNVHRHRLAPEAASDFAQLLTSGTIRAVAGRTAGMSPCGEILRVPIKLRGSADVFTVDADRVINCSGPQHDFRKLENPLIRCMLATGSMVPNPLGIGVRVADDGALIGSDGTPSSRLFAVGPARFGTLIETTAIPEIREQAHELAASLVRASAARDERLAG